MVKLTGGKSYSAKTKVTELNAKRTFSFGAGKNPREIITGTKIKNSDVDMPTRSKSKSTMRAKRG